MSPTLPTSRLLLIFPLSFLLGTACARDPNSDEAAVYSTVLGDFCGATGHPVFVNEESDGLGLGQSSLDYLQSESGLVSPVLFADFSRQRSSRLRLSDAVPLGARCSYRSAAELDAYRDSSSAMQADILPPPGTDSPIHPSVLTLSPIGFDFSANVALVQQFWAGGYGLCYGEFLVLQRPEDRWTVVGRIEHIVC